MHVAYTANICLIKSVENYLHFLLSLTGSLLLTKLLMYSKFAHQLFRQASRSVSAKMGQNGPERSLYNIVALKSMMKE